MEMQELCFACGKDNPIGLKLKFQELGDFYIAEFTPQILYQGYPDILHGGITATILDEAMGQYLFYKGLIALTAELNVRFKKEIPVEKPITICAKIHNQRSRMIEMSAEIKLENGVIAAEAIGKFMIRTVSRKN